MFESKVVVKPEVEPEVKREAELDAEPEVNPGVSNAHSLSAVGSGFEPWVESRVEPEAGFVV